MSDGPRWIPNDRPRPPPPARVAGDLSPPVWNHAEKAWVRLTLDGPIFVRQ